jgi:hypothetical protein
MAAVLKTLFNYAHVYFPPLSNYLQMNLCSNLFNEHAQMKNGLPLVEEAARSNRVG